MKNVTHITNNCFVTDDSIVVLSSNGMVGDPKVEFCYGISPKHGMVPFLSTNGGPVALSDVQFDAREDVAPLVTEGMENPKCPEELKVFLTVELEY